MSYIDVGNENSTPIRLYYEDHGSGHPVVLIHGYPLSSSSWEKQVPALLAAGHRVIAYDRRGFGKSSQPTTGYNYDTFADDLHTLVTHLKLRDFPWSASPWVAARLRATSANTALKCEQGRHHQWRSPYLLKTADNPEGVDGSVFEGIQKAVAADRYAFFTEFFKNFYNTDVYLGKRVSEQAVQASWNVACHGFGHRQPGLRAHLARDFRKDVARIDVPTLVIQGEADRIVPFASAGQPHRQADQRRRTRRDQRRPAQHRVDAR